MRSDCSNTRGWLVKGVLLYSRPCGAGAARPAARPVAALLQGEAGAVAK